MYRLFLYIISIGYALLPGPGSSLSRHGLSFISQFTNRSHRGPPLHLKPRFAKARDFSAPSTLEEWKKDLRDIAGVWSIYYPYGLQDATGFFPTPDVRPTPLFCDVSGRVRGPDDLEGPLGSYLVDARDFHHLDDSSNFVHSRRMVMVLLSAVEFSNLKLVLAGRVFYAKGTLSHDLEDLVPMRPAIFVGQAFLQSYKNEVLEEAMSRLKRKICLIDSEGSEVDPRSWQFQKLEGRGSPFRWMHGNEHWRLLGPFTCYKSLGGVKSDKSQTPLDPLGDDAVYTTVDPLELVPRSFPTRAELDSLVSTILANTFRDAPGMSNIRIGNADYLKALEHEMVELGDKGPEYFKESFE